MPARVRDPMELPESHARQRNNLHGWYGTYGVRGREEVYELSDRERNAHGHRGGHEQQPDRDT